MIISVQDRCRWEFQFAVWVISLVRDLLLKFEAERKCAFENQLFVIYIVEENFFYAYEKKAIINTL